MKTAAALVFALALVPILAPAATPAPPAPAASTAPAKPDLAIQVAQAIHNLEVDDSVANALLQRVSVAYFAQDCAPHGGFGPTPVKFNSADSGKTFTATVVCKDGSTLNERVP